VTDERLEPEAILDALDGQETDYLVTGSLAAEAYGAPGEPAADLDIIPAVTPDNLGRLARALDDLEAQAVPEAGHWTTDELGEWTWVTDPEPRPLVPLDPHDPASFDHSFTTRHGRLDVVPVVAGSYVDLRPRAQRRRIGSADRWLAHPVDVAAGMTRPRRRKDVPRIRHLRSLASRPPPSGVGFIGLRTDRFDAMVALFGELLGLEVIGQEPGATRFRLGIDAELHVYAADEPGHAFFTTGPVVGLRVADVDDARRRMEAAGLEFIGEVERHGGRSWSHFRAPDGTVLEVID
jgi:catechol 2,3-dioxygenase-like lactoylglutathione lyase family enzyme